MSFGLYLLGLVIVGLWFRARPRIGLLSLFIFWWIGLILIRIAPIPLALMVSESDLGEPGSMILSTLALVEWLGSLLILRVVLGLTSWDRPLTKARKIYAGLFALFFLLVPVYPGAPVIFFILAIPWLWSFRWREGLNALPLALASVTALISFILSLVSTDPSPAEDFALRGFVILSGGMTIILIFYSFVSLFATAGRVHVSIRKIGPRLISSHILAGVVPVILVALFLLLSGALFLSTYRGLIGARALEIASRAAEKRIAADISSQGLPGPAPFGDEMPGQVLIVRLDDSPVDVWGGTVPFSAESLLVVEESSQKTPLLWDGNTLFLRARVDTTIAGRSIRAEALAPIDSLHMVGISELVGMPIRVNPSLRVRTAGGGVQVGESDPGQSSSGSIGPSKMNKRDLPGGAIVSCLRQRADGWEASMMPLSSSAGFSEPLLSLFSIARGNPLAWIVLIVLGMIALLFLGGIWITIGMVFQMGRSITRAVHALTRATSELGKGKLDHRISIAGKDELWNVASSFNEMAAGLQQMREVERQTHRLEEELRLAREIQNRLLPSAPPTVDGLELAGLSLPARQVGGDYFDYLLLDRGLVGLAVADVSGKGAPAALLMSSFRASLRTQDLAGLGPAEVLGRLNRFIHASVDPGKFITAFLGLIDPETGEMRYANAGHDPPLLVKPDGDISELTGGGLILGMLPQIVYEEASAELDPGSLVAVFTDGVTEAQNTEGEFFGTARLVELLKDCRQESCDAALRRVVDATQDFAGERAQFDDITMILARRQ